MVEAAGSNPVTQTKRPLLERGAVLCFCRRYMAFGAALQVQSRSFDFQQTFVVEEEYPYNCYLTSRLRKIKSVQKRLEKPKNAAKMAL